MRRQSHEPTARDAESVASELLGQRVECREPHRSRFGDASWRFRISAGSADLLFKVNRRPGSPIGAYYHDRLTEAGVPVPAMLAWRPDAWADEHAAAVYEWVEGTPAEFTLDQPPPYDELQMGEILRSIHDIAHDDGFGHLDDAGHGACDTWHAALLSTWAIEACVQRGAIDGRLGQLLPELAGEFAGDLSDAGTGLLHYEDIMFSGNCIVDDAGRIAAIVDFGGAMAGDPMWELMVFDYYFGAHYPSGALTPGFDLDRFRRGYGLDYDPRAPLQRLYAVGMAVEKLTFVDLASPRAALNRELLDTIVDELAG